MFKKLVVLVLLAAGIATWMQKDPLTQADRVRADELPDVVEPERNAFLGEGIIVRYQSSAVPVYYLLYETQGHRFVRKELRFTEERGCAPTAGDLPCVYVGQNPLPVPLGSYVRVSGLLDAQRIVVSSVEVREDSDRDFTIRTIGVGESFSTKDVTIRLNEVYSQGPCELYLGCYREGIPRTVFTLLNGGNRKEVRMVPGMLEDVADGAVLLLWADEELGEATFVVGHGESR